MNACTPEVVVQPSKPRVRSPRVSVILLDWGVRESYHSLRYLNEQTAERDSYELIWLEFYRRKPEALQRLVENGGAAQPVLDKWIVAGYPCDVIFNKHRLYNLGILASQGEICVICDSDAMFTPTFIDRLIREFETQPRQVVHLDEVRSTDRRFYPFNHPTIDDVLASPCLNWTGTTTRGLDGAEDMLHAANYGACMAARRTDLLGIGGADEHLDYLGYICGPYEMTFRLVNHGLTERWLHGEYLYHTWHPNESGSNTDYQGPHDGRGMSLRALEARATQRVEPHVENPWIARGRRGETPTLTQVLREMAARQETGWRVDRAPHSWDSVYLVDRDVHGFNVFCANNEWLALPVADGLFQQGERRRYRVLLRERTRERLLNIVAHYASLPTGFWGRLRAQPLYRLPGRLVRRVAREFARVW